MNSLLIIGGSLIAGYIIGHYLFPNRKLMERMFYYGHNVGLINGARDTSEIYKIIITNKFGDLQARDIELQAFSQEDHPYGKLVLVKGGKNETK